MLLLHLRKEFLLKKFTKYLQLIHGLLKK